MRFVQWMLADRRLPQSIRKPTHVWPISIALALFLPAVAAVTVGCVSSVIDSINREPYEKRFGAYLENPYGIVENIHEGWFDADAYSNVEVSRTGVKSESIDKSDLFSKKRGEKALRMLYESGADREKTMRGEVMLITGWHKSAIDFHTSALILRRRYGTLDEIAQSLAYLGLVYYYLGEWSSAFPYLKEARTIYRKIDNQVALESTEYFIADILVRSGQDA